MKVSEKIRSIRQLKTFSQEDMAEKLGVSKNTYAKIERGETDVQLSRLEQIAEAFEMEFTELLMFGEKGITCVMGNVNQFRDNNLWQNYSDVKAHLELEKLQIVIEQQTKEIEYLKEIIALIKNQA